jgi:CheY-like chemotaxis protein/predicted regulator of Ras-like GTPase activity (Roadblock/LC7/MglB family)
MSDVSRIFVVEGDEALNRNLVNTLRKDGYSVQGVTNGTDAVRILWSEECDIVICDLKTHGPDGFELLQWLRAYRPNTQMLLVGNPGSEGLYMQALENGAAGYLEKPLDLHMLKGELRRLTQRTGFSANLDSFDLLDVIQIITMSRKTIALLVNTGLEERGLLRFYNGELVWAEYGALLGEEAFFALAAHKNGTVTHQPWNGQIVSNVTQPLSRLIFQALQYRNKYANTQPLSDEEVVGIAPVLAGHEVDDSPFTFVEEASSPLLVAEGRSESAPILQPVAQTEQVSQQDSLEKEWWQRTGSIPLSAIQNAAAGEKLPVSNGEEKKPATRPEIGTIGHKTVVSQRADLPSWLTDQPTSSGMPALRPSTTAGSGKLPKGPVDPTTLPGLTPDTLTPQWPVVPQALDNRDQDATRQMTVTGPRQALGTHLREQHEASPASSQLTSPEQTEQSWMTSKKQNTLSTTGLSGSLSIDDLQESSPLHMPQTATSKQRATRRAYNYPALVSALRTVGYSAAGFIATALVSMEGQPIAQVAVEDLDIAEVCKQLSAILKGTQRTLDQEQWGSYEHMVISSSNRTILMRLIGAEKTVFQLLITTQDTDIPKCLEIMTNVEAAIQAALR